MAVWTLHNAARYAFIPTEGPAVLFEFYNCGPLSADLETVDEGVELEQQVLITESGPEVRSTYTFEDELLGREI